jgi:hypothetical protein
VSGIVFGHYFWLLAERYCYIVDVKIFKIPFNKRFPAFTKSCNKCQHPMELWSDPSAPHNHTAGGLGVKEERRIISKEKDVQLSINEI